MGISREAFADGARYRFVGSLSRGAMSGFSLANSRKSGLLLHAEGIVVHVHRTAREAKQQAANTGVLHRMTSYAARRRNLQKVVISAALPRNWRLVRGRGQAMRPRLSDRRGFRALLWRARTARWGCR